MEDKKLHHFIIKPDGKLYWIQDMPVEPVDQKNVTAEYASEMVNYQQALQSAKDNAIEVLNHEQCRVWLGKIYDRMAQQPNIMPLECEVEITNKCFEGSAECYCEKNLANGCCGGFGKVAVVSLSEKEPEVKEETQDELWGEVISRSEGAMRGPVNFDECRKYLKSKYTITRNP